MSQTQFISHAQVVPAPTVVKQSSGMGLFGALFVVLAILMGAATGGLVMLEKKYKEDVTAAEKEIEAMKQDLEVTSIKEAEALQRRIDIAAKILNSHVYSSQVFELLERQTLSPVAFTRFAYADRKISISVNVPGYLEFAQQVKHYRKLLGDTKELASFIFSEPKLASDGSVDFDVELVLNQHIINKGSSERVDIAPGETASTTPTQ